MTLTRNELRMLANWLMLPHLFIGHPIAAVLSRVGLRTSAEWWHWRTLPARSRRKVGLKQLRFDHHPSLFLADFFFAPLCHLLGCFGQYYLSFRLFSLGPIEAIADHSTHVNFIAWGEFSPDPLEREFARSLLAKARRRGAYLTTVGQPRWPHLGQLHKSQ